MNIPKEEQTTYHTKAWGYELWLVNNYMYCGKKLHFNKNGKFSMHFHIKKTETWYILSGIYDLFVIDTNKADKYLIKLKAGDCYTILPGQPHQIHALEEGDILEISTQHFETDSYRIEAGDSQLTDNKIQDCSDHHIDDH